MLPLAKTSLHFQIYKVNCSRITVNKKKMKENPNLLLSSSDTYLITIYTGITVANQSSRRNKLTRNEPSMKILFLLDSS